MHATYPLHSTSNAVLLSLYPTAELRRRVSRLKTVHSRGPELSWNESTDMDKLDRVLNCICRLCLSRNALLNVLNSTVKH